MMQLQITILLVFIGLLALNIPISQTEARTLQCPGATWRIYSDSCYRLSTRSDTYNDATKACVDEGAVLTSILTSDEQSFLSDMAEQKEVWIGLNDKKTEGDFKWVDGSNYEYTHWENYEPSDGSCRICFSEDCVHMKNNGKWNDESCGGLIPMKIKYICKSHAIPLLTTTEATFTDHTSAVSSQGLITSTTTTVNPGSTSSFYSDQPKLTSEYILASSGKPHPTTRDSRSTGPGGPYKQRDSPPTGLIAGVLVGAVLLIVIVVILVLWFRRSRSTKYPMKEQSSGQAYVGPCDLTNDGINGGVVIQSNGNVKYETKMINDATPTAYENLSTIQHQEITGGDKVYAAVDENGENSPSRFDNQVSVIYAKPIKNNLKQLHHDESTLSSNPEDANTVYVKSDSAKGLCEGSMSPASVQRECDEDEEGWHDNELYGDLNAEDVDENLNALSMQHMSETPAANVNEVAINMDADDDSDEDTGWEDNVIYGETQHTPDTVKDKNDGEDEGWEENKIYSGSDN